MRLQSAIDRDWDCDPRMRVSARAALQRIPSHVRPSLFGSD
jgi:hypothetical protein